ncbi:Paramyosin, partial [Clonorchis sinensis]
RRGSLKEKFPEEWMRQTFHLADHHNTHFGQSNGTCKGKRIALQYTRNISGMTGRSLRHYSTVAFHKSATTLRRAVPNPKGTIGRNVEEQRRNTRAETSSQKTKSRYIHLCAGSKLGWSAVRILTKAGPNKEHKCMGAWHSIGKSTYKQAEINLFYRLVQYPNIQADNILRTKTTTRTIEELTVTITEMEVKYKSELSRLKKRYESNIAELELQLDTANKANANLMKENKTLAQRVKDLEAFLEEERRLREAAESNLQASERKRIQLSSEVEELRGALEAADRARKHAENEMNEAQTRVSELTMQVNTLTNDKRRLEGDISVMQADMDEAINAKAVRRENEAKCSIGFTSHRRQYLINSILITDATQKVNVTSLLVPEIP